MKSYVDMKTPVVNEVHLALHGRLWHLLNPQLHEVMSSLYLNMICLHVDAPYLLCATLAYTCRKIFCFCSFTCSYRYRIRSKHLWCRRESRMILVLEILQQCCLDRTIELRRKLVRTFRGGSRYCQSSTENTRLRYLQKTQSDFTCSAKRQAKQICCPIRIVGTVAHAMVGGQENLNKIRSPSSHNRNMLSHSQNIC